MKYAFICWLREWARTIDTETLLCFVSISVAKQALEKNISTSWKLRYFLELVVVVD